MTYDDWLEIEDFLFEVPRKFYNQSLESLKARHTTLTNEEFSGWYHTSLAAEVKHATGEINKLEDAIVRLRQDLGKYLVGPSKVTMCHLRLRHIPDTLKKKYSIGPQAEQIWDVTETPLPPEMIEIMDTYLGMSVMLR